MLVLKHPERAIYYIKRYIFITALILFINLVELYSTVQCKVNIQDSTSKGGLVQYIGCTGLTVNTLVTFICINQGWRYYVCADPGSIAVVDGPVQLHNPSLRLRLLGVY